MPKDEEQDPCTGIYKSHDPVQNFKLRVHLRHVKAAHIPLPQFFNDEQDQDGISSASATASVSASGISDLKSNITDGEVRLFAWQEKVFSRYEVELYSNISNCHSAVQEQYHHEVSSSRRSQNDRLFSYVQNDDTTAIGEAQNMTIIGLKPFKNPLVQALHEVQGKQHYTYFKANRKLWKRQHIILKEGSGDIKHHIVHGVPQASCQKMYIMADLSPTSEIGKSEYVLCEIRWDVSSNTLFITPDISGPPNSAKPYRIEVDGDARNVYEFWLEHASNMISEEASHQEEEVLSKMYTHQANLRNLRIGDEFSMPARGTLSTFLFGQISSLQNFDDRPLFVHYFVELPRGWSCDEPETLSGISAVCQPSRGVVHIGHPLQFQLQLSLAEFENSPDVVPQWPQLMIEVMSMDWWGRYHSEGYGYITLPTFSGVHSVKCHTWRPLGSSPFNELRRFFIGGNPELEDVTFVGVPQHHEGPLLGKYGVQTIPSGDIKMSFNLVLQTPVSSHQHSFRTAAALLERLSAATLVNSVNQVLTAFRRAHERMLAAKQGLYASNEDSEIATRSHIEL